MREFDIGRQGSDKVLHGVPLYLESPPSCEEESSYFSFP
jgi:hypothetical protein